LDEFLPDLTLSHVTLPGRKSYLPIEQAIRGTIDLAAVGLKNNRPATASSGEMVERQPPDDNRHHFHKD
jgi:hypothetical protein